MAREFSRNGVVDADAPVCFGTMAGNGEDCSAPMATKRVLLKVKQADGNEYFLNDEQDRHIIARSYMILAGHCGPEALAEMRDILDESALACAFHSSSSGSGESPSLSVEQSDEAVTQQLQNEFPDLSLAEIAWLQRQHKNLGHSSSIENLCRGQAKRAMKKMRSLCKKCCDFDDVRSIQERGALLQFANDKNELWIADSSKTRLGRARVLRSLNIAGHSIGYKSAYRISKLERMNGDHRKNVRKLTVEPYDEHIAALVWSRASVNAFEESLSDVVDQVLQTRNDSDENFLDMTLKREINNEHNYQCNCLPILGTALSPYNLNSGGHYAGSRDWERLKEDLTADADCRDELEKWFTAKAKLQKTVRQSIVKLDLQEILRRRELVGRSFKRVADMSRLRPGMEVLARRKDDGFYHNPTGEVVTVYNDGADVRVGTGTTKYLMKDLAIISNDPTGTILETYVDEEFGEELEPLGGGDFGHICEECGRVFTSRNRLLQHISEVHGDGNPNEGCIYFAKEDTITKDDFLHPTILKEVQNCTSRMELKMEDGKAFLSPAEVDTAGAKERAYDFTVLPAVSAALKGKQKHVGRLMHTDSICWQMSQLLNGRAIDTELNNKNNRDVSYVVTAVEINRGRPLSPSKFRGSSIMVRWGETTTPALISEKKAVEENQEDCWYARLFYEVPADAHEQLQAHVEGHKSSALEISEEAAALMGFESYFLPSVRNEVKAVMKHGIFGRSADKKDVTDKNTITSRLVVVIKVDLGTG
eukprot:g18387.t1